MTVFLKDILMKTHSEFQILGRVGKIKHVGPTLRVTIAADYGKRGEDGTFEAKPFWNEVTIFNDKTAKWVGDNINAGDLVFSRGTIRQTSYESNGSTVYGVTLASDEFSLLAEKHVTG